MNSALPELIPLLGPVAVFVLTMTATPGPNNMMLTASGANFGFRRTVPHIFGVVLGCAILNVAVALGLGTVFTQWPQLQTMLKVTGSVYLLWLAWKIASAPPPETDKNAEARPMSLLQAAAFQFANPKAWVMSISGLASFTLVGDAFLASALMFICIMALVGFPSISMWAGFGVMISRLLKTAWHWRCFNLGMGTLTAACVAMILL